MGMCSNMDDDELCCSAKSMYAVWIMSLCGAVFDTDRLCEADPVEPKMFV